MVDDGWGMMDGGWGTFLFAKSIQTFFVNSSISEVSEKTGPSVF